MRYHIILACLPGAMPLALAEQEERIQKDVAIYQAVVAGTEVKVVVSEQPFDPGKHKTTELKNQGTDEEPDWVGATVDGKPVVGTDQTLPAKDSPQLARIVVHFGDQQVEVPTALLNHVFHPNLHKPGTFTVEVADSIISVSSDAKCVLIDLAVGDGGGTSTVFFAVSKDGKATTAPPQRPEP